MRVLVDGCRVRVVPRPGMPSFDEVVYPTPEEASKAAERILQVFSVHDGRNLERSSWVLEQARRQFIACLQQRRDRVRQPATPPRVSSRTGSRPREHRARRSTGTSRSRGDPPPEPDDPELARLTAQAFDLRESSYFRDAIQAIVDWFERRHERRLDRRDDGFARLVRLLERTS
jgi:hypothetical protein